MNESMPLVDSNEYYSNLSTLRDQALVRSNSYGRRRRLGGLAWGCTKARWDTDRGDTLYLYDTGLRIGDSTLLRSHPTTMQILSECGRTDTAVTTFKMDLDNIGDILVFRNMLTSRVFRDTVRMKLSRRTDRRHDMTVPTDEDLALVYTEMERGASGMYSYLNKGGDEVGDYE